MAIELQQPCLDACLASARACEQCQHVCLEEAAISKYAKPLCITRDGADVGVLLARFLARQSDDWREAYMACSQLCKIGADECGHCDGEAESECARLCRQAQPRCRHAGRGSLRHLGCIER